MKSFLRKGDTCLKFQYEYGVESIQAIMTSVEVEGKTLIVSTVLSPLSDTQFADLNMLLRHNESITNIVVRDDLVRKKLEKFHRYNKGKFERQSLSVQFRESIVFSFDINLHFINENVVGFEVIA